MDLNYLAQTRGTDPERNNEFLINSKFVSVVTTNPAAFWCVTQERAM